MPSIEIVPDQDMQDIIITKYHTSQLFMNRKRDQNTKEEVEKRNIQANQI